MSNITHITTAAEFKKEILDEAEKTVLVDFFAQWCQPCKMLAPVVEKLAEETKSLKVVEVDVDAAQELASQYGVMSIPTMYVFKKGKAVKQMIGFQDRKALEEALRAE